MKVTTMSQMWEFLQTYTLNAAGEERSVNHLNEWGGYSRYLNLSVFTAWADQLSFDKENKTTSALVLNPVWAQTNSNGVNNNKHWLNHSEKFCAGDAAFFIIHAKDTNALRRTVKYIDADRIFIGKILRLNGLTYLAGQPHPI